MNCGCRTGESWGDRINTWLKDHPPPWSEIDRNAIGDGYEIVDNTGNTIFNLHGTYNDVVCLVDYINFQATPGH